MSTSRIQKEKGEWTIRSAALTAAIRSAALAAAARSAVLTAAIRGTALAVAMRSAALSAAMRSAALTAAMERGFDRCNYEECTLRFRLRLLTAGFGQCSHPDLRPSRANFPLKGLCDVVKEITGMRKGLK